MELNNKNLSERNRKLCEELNKKIDEELAKDDENIDLEKVAASVKLLNQIQGNDDVDNIDLQLERDNFMQYLKNSDKKKGKLIVLRRAVSVACVFIVLVIVGNVASAKAFDYNFIDKIIQMGANFFGIDNYSTGEIVPAGEVRNFILEKLGDDGNDFLFPANFPDDLKLEQFGKTDLNSYTEYDFCFSTDKYKICMVVDEFESEKPESMFFNESNCMAKYNVNGMDVYIVGVDDTYTALFADGQQQYQIISEMNFDDFSDMIRSIK